MACFEDQIVEYASGNLSAQEADRVRGHLNYCEKCNAYYLSLQKLDSALGTWQEPGAFGEEFDNKLIIACEDRLAKREFVRDILKPSLKYAYMAAAAVLLLLLYRNTFYDGTAGTFTAVRSASITCETEVKDVGIYLEQKFMFGLLEKKQDFTTLSNIDTMLNVPQSGPADTRAEDLKFLLKSAVSSRREKRNFLFNFLDSTVIFIEQVAKLKMAFAAEKTPAVLLTDFEKATEYLEHKDYEKAIDGYTAALAGNLAEPEARAAEFRVGYLQDISGNYVEAGRHYNTVAEKYRGSVEALLIPDMKRFSQARRSLDLAAEKEEAAASEGRDTASTYYIIGNARMLHLDFDGATRAYNDCISKFYGSSKRRSKVNMAWCFKQKGDYKSAIAQYKKFGDLDQDHRIYGEYEMSLAYVKLGDYEKAKSVISNVTKEEYPAAYKKLVEKYFTEISKAEPVKTNK